MVEVVQRLQQGLRQVAEAAGDAQHQEQTWHSRCVQSILCASYKNFALREPRLYKPLQRSILHRMQATARRIQETLDTVASVDHLNAVICEALRTLQDTTEHGEQRKRA